MFSLFTIQNLFEHAPSVDPTPPKAESAFTSSLNRFFSSIRSWFQNIGTMFESINLGRAVSRSNSPTHITIVSDQLGSSDNVDSVFKQNLVMDDSPTDIPIVSYQPGSSDKVDLVFEQNPVIRMDEDGEEEIYYDAINGINSEIHEANGTTYLFVDCEEYQEDKLGTIDDITSTVGSNPSVVIKPPDSIIPVETAVKKDIFEVSETERDIIKGMLAIMAQGNAMTQSEKLKSDGKKIKQVHPLAFLRVVLSDHESKKNIRTLQKATVWSIILQQTFSGLLYGNPFESEATRSGFLKKLEEMNKANELTPYTAEFAVSLGLSNETLIKFIQNNQWQELTNYIIVNAQ